MSDYNYFVEDGELFRFDIMHDDEARDPREENEGYIGTLNLWWNRYVLGDNDGKGNADEMLSDMIRELVPQEKWTDEALDYDMTRNQKILMLQECEDILLLYCFIYEHGGLTISCGNVGYPYNDRFDAGIAGFIYTTKEKCKEQWCEIGEDWKKKAYEELQAEVREYDNYLRGNCYGYTLEKYSAEDDDWDETESVWGYLTDDFGNELVEFFRKEITDKPLISEESALELAKEMRNEYEVMEQAETIVAI